MGNAAEQSVASEGDAIPASSDAARGTVLFVDDEPEILSSLKRVARRLKFDVLTANGGAEGLAILKQSRVNVVVSDMRMPEMSGAVFLGEVAAAWPETVRILLTGYADLASAVEAINRGQPYRYLSKPWEDEELRGVLIQAMELSLLRGEKDRLELLSQQQNEELVALNSTLEARVEERTRQVHKAADLLAQANRDINDAYGTTVQVFASLIQSGARDSAGIRKIAELAQATASAIGLDEEACNNTHLAGLLCELGKLALPDEIVGKPAFSLKASEAAEFRRHPLISESVLLPLKPLEAVAVILRSHCEYVDGSGYPDGLIGDAIPLGAQILCITKDYDALTRGLLLPEALTPAEALKYIKDHSGSCYASSVVEVFVGLVDRIATDDNLKEIRVGSTSLAPGMRLTRDLMNDHGVLIIPAGYRLDSSVVAKLQRIDKDRSDKMVIFVEN